MGYMIIRQKDGKMEQLKEVGIGEGVWYPFGETPKGCSFNLPVIFDTVRKADKRCCIEEEKDPSFAYFIDEFNR